MSDQRKGEVKLLQQQPNENLIDLLEEMLTDAKSGELQSVAGVSFYTEQRIRQYWSLKRGLGVMPMLAEISVLHRNFMDRFVDLDRKPLIDYCE